MVGKIHIREGKAAEFADSDAGLEKYLQDGVVSWVGSSQGEQPRVLLRREVGAPRSRLGALMVSAGDVATAPLPTRKRKYSLMAASFRAHVRPDKP